MPYFKQTFITLIVLSSPVSSIAQTCQTTSIQATTPSNQFKDNGNGTITDTKTGLMWKKCSEGQTGNNCKGVAQSYSWQNALTQAQTVNQTVFASYKDWRVPNIKELTSIVEEQCIDPAINMAIFPNTPNNTDISRNTSNNWFWSSSPYAYDSKGAWIVHFIDGTPLPFGKNEYGYVRLVRGGL